MTIACGDDHHPRELRGDGNPPAHPLPTGPVVGVMPRDCANLEKDGPMLVAEVVTGVALVGS